MKMKKFIIWENRNWWPHNTYISYTLISLYRAPLKLWVLKKELKWSRHRPLGDAYERERTISNESDLEISGLCVPTQEGESECA